MIFFYLAESIQISGEWLSARMTRNFAIVCVRLENITCGLRKVFLVFL